MAKFRETLWFKKGQLDAEQAEQAAGDDESIGAVDLLPSEDRYLDDGSVDSADTRAFGVHTGATTGIAKLGTDVGDEDTVEERLLVREMKGGRVRVLAAIAASAAVLVAAVLAF